MTELIEKLILTLLCSTGLFHASFDPAAPVIAVLSAVIGTCLVQAVNKRPFQYLMTAAYLCGCLQSSCFVVFLPVIVYDISRQKLYPMAVPTAAVIVYRLTADLTPQLATTVVVLCAAAVLVERLSAKNKRLELELIVTRDSAVEYNNELVKKNSQLIEAQDNEVHLATLKERNRIAREIHDNVGHMLTRTILQMGAIGIINKDENLKEPLESVKTTLDDAMNSIRKSVHDLHDDSIDLEASLRDAIEPLKKDFKVTFDYDVHGRISGKIKYCFIAIVKEAVNNIIKHSSGDSAVITVREHPGMCTLCVEDNGSCSETVSGSGIGLENMSDRVKALGGVLTITPSKQGFRIFVSIMKRNGEQNK